ncbi:unnamed protein product [Albugo candida]|uniref:non-specific serine/threonine protein kinase n=1 Tax=Albugo candida TaxID=65357 RepID=A0A024GFG7_9STRA|nr:unnamed protein product [Albugo candida]|eukprot:CCI45278.1 unnamed protein product [Albugo candida]
MRTYGICVASAFAVASRRAWSATETLGAYLDEISIAAGVEHSCAIYLPSNQNVAGRVVCWGDNQGGQCSAPAGEFVQISCGRLHSCGIRQDETIECWGSGIIEKAPEGIYQQVSSGDFHSCGLLRDHSIRCWGEALSEETTPPKGSFVQVSCGRGYTCAVKDHGQGYCWGENSQGQCDVPSNISFLQISASSGDFTCGVTTDFAVICWGNNSRMQCSVPQNHQFILVSAGRFSACGLTKARYIVCWGLRSGVTSAPKDTQFDEIAIGSNHGCGLGHSDGKIQCWGDRSQNKLLVPSIL